MAKRGRPPKPVAEKARNGNPGNRKLVEKPEETDLSSGSLRMPTRFSAVEKKVWNDLMGAFPKWYFRPADLHLMIMYCHTMARMQKSESALKNKPLVDKKSTGTPCRNPHVQIISECQTQILRLSGALELTRATRKGLGLTPAPLPTADGNPTPVGEEDSEFGTLISEPYSGPKE